MTKTVSPDFRSVEQSPRQARRFWESLHTQRMFRTIFEWIAALVLGFIVLFPVLWLIKSSFQSPVNLFAREPVFSLDSFTLINYITILTDPTVIAALRNSLIIAVGSTIISMTIGVLSAYAFARLHFRGRNLLFVGVLMTQMLPGIVLVIPMYMIMRRFGLLNSYAGLLLAYISFTLPYCIWLQRAYMVNAPWELEDQARVDGCTRLGALVRVILPTITPGLITTLIYSFVNTWNEYLFAIVLTNPQTKTITVRLSEFVSQERVAVELMFPTAIIATIPALILVAVFGRYIVSGLTAGALKGQI
ncbi:MAG: carbohydrate ABC transporter permease [Chloroflexi bacterium]|nr:carbohydrate ABC transporter permease [Chloroflexota bacterium]